MIWLFARDSAPSIRTSVLIWQLSALLLLGSVAVVSAYSLAVRSFTELRNLELAQISDAVARHGIDADDTGDSGSEQPGDFLSQVWEADGRLSYASHDPPVARPQRVGHFDFSYDKQPWHGYAANYQGQTVLVAREAHTRGSLFARISLPLLVAIALLTLVLMALLGLKVRRELAPLETLRSMLEQRASTSLEHIVLPDAPRELIPLASTLNTMFDRIGALVDGQQRFTADAAHELRTPVTAVGLFAQLARKDAEAGRGDALLPHIASIEACCLRASGLIEQLLTLARLDPENPPHITSVALHELVRDAVAELSALADSAGIDLGLVGCDAVQVLGDPAELRILVDNLIGNAVRYTPRGGRVDVSLEHREGGLSLVIDDTGPGLPATELERVFERFHRVAGQDKPGSGLGLAIVRRIAQRYELTVCIENRTPAGLHVVVGWAADAVQGIPAAEPFSVGE